MYANSTPTATKALPVPSCIPLDLPPLLHLPLSHFRTLAPSSEELQQQLSLTSSQLMALAHLAVHLSLTVSSMLRGYAIKAPIVSTSIQHRLSRHQQQYHLICLEVAALGRLSQGYLAIVHKQHSVVQQQMLLPRASLHLSLIAKRTLLRLMLRLRSSHCFLKVQQKK